MIDTPLFWLSLAILAPAILTLSTLCLPKGWVETRFLLALLGPSLAACFVIKGSYGNTYPTYIEHASHHHDDAHPVESVLPTLHEEVASLQTDTLYWMDKLHLNVQYLPDGLGVFFALLVALIGCCIVLYARGYFGKVGHGPEDLWRFYPKLGFFMTAMLGVVLSDNVLLMVMFWEMTSISSFLLIGWDKDNKESVRKAMQAFFTTGLGGMALVGGTVCLGGTTGIWTWSGMYEAIAHGGLPGSHFWIGAGFFMCFIGAWTKSAQWPFHYWLPGAMAAPTPVSAFLHSATMVKAGVFLIGRFYPIFGIAGGHELALWSGLLPWLGAITMLLGGYLALQQHDLKRIFAYTTVSQLGLLVTMYGLGGMVDTHGHALMGMDITQIANHAFYKAPLFIAAGAIGHVLSRDITQLHGAFKKHKGTCLVLLLAGYALAALPGSVSFQAKELFLYSALKAADIRPELWLIVIMTIITAMCNVAIFVRIFCTLLGLPGSMRQVKDLPHEHHAHEHEHSILAHLIWIPGLLIVSMQYLGGLMPNIWMSIFAPLEPWGHPHDVYTLGYIFTHPNGLLAMSGVAIAGGIALGLSFIGRGTVKDPHDKIYPALYWLAVSGGGYVFRFVQRGKLGFYTSACLLIMFALVVGGLAMDAHAIKIPAIQDFSIGSHALMTLGLAVIACASTVLIPFSKSRMARVILLGTCGFSVVGIYLAWQAPDLALTQLSCEVISVLLFVVVLRLLPAEKIDIKKRFGKQAIRIAIAVPCGLLMGLMTWIIAPTNVENDTDRLGHHLALASHIHEGDPHAPDLDQIAMRDGGGDNIVNVILVDFRGFDTLGEITVLALAAIGIWSMMPGRRRKTYALDKKSKEAII